MAVSESATDFETMHEIVKVARANLDKGAWDYLMGGAETETTLRRNRRALASIALRPRVLRDMTKVDCSGTLLGKTLRIPVLLAPIGSVETFTPEGGVAPAKAAAEFGIVHMLSSRCAPGLEAVAAAADNLRMFQLYVRGGDDFVDDHARRAMSHGYYAFCVTVDSAHYSRRDRDLANRFVKKWRRNVVQSELDYQAAYDWDNVKRLKDTLAVPLILKGIMTAEDAGVAVEHGVEGVYISNHGGRQLDHGQGTLDVLPEIVRAVDGKAEVIIDGGFARGIDVVKAIAMGANAVGIGRLQGLALATAGVPGLVRALELLEIEMTVAMGLMGATSLAALDTSFITLAQPIGEASALSAFPLLDEGY